jgi:lipid-binding SYLF domain-containing protein
MAPTKSIAELANATPSLSILYAAAVKVGLAGALSSAGKYTVFAPTNGALGNGIVFQKNRAVGTANLSQLSIGLQAGGQGYREVIFFENKSNFDEFKENNLKLSAQTSAVIAASGASANVNYANGILIFAQPKGGLMYEVSVGGQSFNYKAFEK